MIGETFDADQRRAHARDHGDIGIVRQISGIDQLHPLPLPIEHAHVEQRQVRIAAASRAEDPGPHGKRFDIVLGDLARAHAKTLLNSMS